MATRYVAGASGLPFAVLRGYAGTDLADHTATIAPITCPFTGEVLMAVAGAATPTSRSSTPSGPTAGATCSSSGSSGVQKEAVLAATHAIVTVEEIVDELHPLPDAVVLPAWVIDAVCEVPGGAHPSFAMGYGVRDNDLYKAWDDIAREPRARSPSGSTATFAAPPTSPSTAAVPGSVRPSRVPPEEDRRWPSAPRPRATTGRPTR